MVAGIYDADFSTNDLSNIKDQLQTFIRHVRRIDDFTSCHDFGSLSVKMVETERHLMFLLVYRLIELALLLPVATTSVERVFFCYEHYQDRSTHREFRFHDLLVLSFRNS